jgi:hypothetical protein
VGGFYQACEFVGGNQRDVLIASSVDYYNLSILCDLAAESGEIGSGFCVGCLNGHGILTTFDMYRVTVRL